MQKFGRQREYFICEERCKFAERVMQIWAQREYFMCEEMTSCVQRERDLPLWLVRIFDSLFMKDNVLYCYPVGGIGNEKG